MDLEKNHLAITDINGEAERIRDVFNHSFRHSDEDLQRLIPGNVTDAIISPAKSEPISRDDEFDWSITVANVELIVDANNMNKMLVDAAERRAEAAELKAKEALHWLQMLHKAVLRGLPSNV